MIRGSFDTPEGPVILAGLTERNLHLLRAGKPIAGSLETFGVSYSGHLVIVYGKTEEEIYRKIAEVQGEGNRSLVRESDEVMAEREFRREHPKILIATVGLPRSGKSSWARSLPHPIVNPDAIRLALHGKRFDPAMEKEVWGMAQMMVRALFQAGHDTVVLDATNITRSRRDEWASQDWDVRFKEVDTPVEECIRRADEARDHEMVGVIISMAERYEALADDEPRWEF